MLITTVSDFRRAIRVGPYTWPGCYDIFFVTSDGAALCHKCANAERRLIVDSIATERRDGWNVAAMDCTADYDGPLTCDNCNTHIVEESF